MTPKALSREKLCGICKKEFRGIKYCSNKCAYEAIKLNNQKRKSMQQNNYEVSKGMSADGRTYNGMTYPHPKNKNKRYKVIVGSNKFINFYYDQPHAKCTVTKVFLLPIYIIWWIN